MSIKDKIKSALRSVCGTKNPSKPEKTAAELAADEVIQKELFPDARNKTNGKKAAAATKKRTTGSEHAKDNAVSNKQPKKLDNSAKKPASKRTRPTNNGYEMIDPDHNTCDTAKS